MTDPRWHDGDPRPPYGGVPGPESRPTRRESGSRPRDPDYRPRRRRPQPQPARDDPDPWRSWHGPDKWPSRREPNFRPSRDDPPPEPALYDPASEPSIYDPYDRPRYDPDDRNRFEPDDRNRFGRGRSGHDTGDRNTGDRNTSDWDTGGRAARRGPGDRRPSRRREPPPDRGLSGLEGTAIVLGAAVLGAIVTVVTRKDPGNLLGAFIVAGTILAAFLARVRSAYVLIPAPALAYVLTAMVSGLVHDHTGGSASALTASATQWIAGGFLTMAAATLAALVIAVARWYRTRRGPGYPGPGTDPAPRGLSGTGSRGA